MATQWCAFDKMRQTFQLKLALNNNRRIWFLNKLHIPIGLGTENARTGEIALARKDQIISNRFDFNTV